MPITPSLRFRLPPIPAAGDAELTAWLEAELREALGEGTLPPPPVLIPEETATPREARRAVVWVGRRLERLPLLWRLGRRFVSLVRGARPT